MMRLKRLQVWPNWRPHGDEVVATGRQTKMLIARWIFLLLFAASVVCFALYIGSGQVRYRQWGLLILKWAVAAGLAFFAVLVLERLVLMV
jgi:hypothetical protein